MRVCVALPDASPLMVDEVVLDSVNNDDELRVAAAVSADRVAVALRVGEGLLL